MDYLSYKIKFSSSFKTKKAFLSYLFCTLGNGNICFYYTLYYFIKSKILPACYDEHRNLMYSKRKYQCSTCNHIKWIDTRYGDPFSKV